MRRSSLQLPAALLPSLSAPFPGPELRAGGAAFDRGLGSAFLTVLGCPSHLWSPVFFILQGGRPRWKCEGGKERQQNVGREPLHTPRPLCSCRRQILSLIFCTNLTFTQRNRSVTSLPATRSAATEPAFYWTSGQGCAHTPHFTWMMVVVLVGGGRAFL